MGTLDMRTLPGVPEALTGRVEIATETVVYGLIGWFDCTLAEGIGFGTGPDDAPTHWRQIYFPFAEPLTVHPGRPLDITIRLPREGDLPEPCWAWKVTDGVNERSTDELVTIAESRAVSRGDATVTNPT
jgi:protein arginine N-methyltransferase 1/protein arginine N-methyltransferase 3